MEIDLRKQLVERMGFDINLHPVSDWVDAVGNILGAIRAEYQTGELSEKSAKYLLRLFNQEAKKFGHKPVTWKQCIRKGIR